MWTGTSGRYFLYGRLRDIISTEPKSSRMLTYCRETKSRPMFEAHTLLIYCCTSFIRLNELNQSFWQLLVTCVLLSSTATSGRLTTRSTFGEEKSTSERGFIRSLALAEIGRKTRKAEQEVKRHDKSGKTNYTRSESRHSLN